MDSFDKTRDAVWGLPGFHVKRSTIVTKPSLVIGQSTWIIETVRTDEESAIFLQQISAEGSQRIIIPSAVCQAIYRHDNSITKLRRSDRAKRAMATRWERVKTLHCITDPQEEPQPANITNI